MPRVEYYPAFTTLVCALGSPSVYRVDAGHGLEPDATALRYFPVTSINVTG